MPGLHVAIIQEVQGSPLNAYPNEIDQFHGLLIANTVGVQSISRAKQNDGDSVMKWYATLILCPLSLTFHASAIADDCVAGPKCSEAGQVLKNYVPSMQAKLRGGSAQAAIAHWCVMRMTAEVSGICADEQASMAKARCADLAYKQKQAALDAADQSAENARMHAQSNGKSWDDFCGFND